MEKICRIYVGGPVGKEIDDGAGLTFRDHSTNLAAAAQEIAKRIESLDADCRVVILDPAADRLATLKFPSLTLAAEADIGMIDLSVASPSAMYEAAFMHALGKPVVPITLSVARVPDGRRLCQYMKDDLASLVPDFRVETLVEMLLPKVQTAMAAAQAAPSNPIAQYYGGPLTP